MALTVTNTSFAQGKTKYIDSLRAVLPLVDHMDRFNTLFYLFRESLSSDLKNAEMYAKEAYQVAVAERDTLAIVKSSNAIGYVKKEMGFAGLAIPYFERALVLSRIKNYRDQVKFLLNNLGLANELVANYAKALEYHLESVKLREEDKDTVAISVALNNIGVLYQQLEDYENAFKYYKQNYDLNLQIEERYNFEFCLINLADINNVLGHYDEAKKYIREVIKFCGDSTNNCYTREIASAHNVFGQTYMNTEEYKLAEQEFLITLNLYTELMLPNRADSYHSIASVRFKLGDIEGAIDNLVKAEKLAEELEIPKYKLKNYKLFAEIYTQKKEFQLASAYQKKYMDLNDEIYNADLIKNIALVQSQHQEEENLRVIAARDQEIVIRDQTLNFQKKQFLFLGVIAALVTVLAMVFYRAQKRQSRSNSQLEVAKRTIETKNHQLELSNAELDSNVKERTKELYNSNEAYKKVNEELDHFIYKTSHDIRGPLTNLKGITYLAIQEAREKPVIDYLNKLDLTADKLNKVLTRLQVINQINQASLTPDLIDFNSMVEEIIVMERKRGLPAGMSINTQIQSGIVLFSDKALMQIVLENLIDNAIKFYNEYSEHKAPFVDITIKEGVEGTTINVLDNGIGIKNIKPTEVFRMFVRASERSKMGGIGLYLAKLSTEKLGGSIELNVTPEEFTEFVVKLPSDLRTVLNARAEKERSLIISK